MTTANEVEFSTADLHDAQPKEVDVIDLQFRSFGKRSCFYGPVETLRVFENHSSVREAARSAGDGRILFVDGGGSLRYGLLGDQIGEAAVRNGWAGIIIVGAIRDSAAVDKLDLGVRALGTTARRSDVARAGKRGVVLKVAQSLIYPGSWLYADRDAIVTSRNPLNLPGA
jgi:regulator of ribonuclease activity A